MINFEKLVLKYEKNIYTDRWCTYKICKNLAFPNV